MVRAPTHGELLRTVADLMKANNALREEHQATVSRLEKRVDAGPNIKGLASRTCGELGRRSPVGVALRSTPQLSFMPTLEYMNGRQPQNSPVDHVAHHGQQRGQIKGEERHSQHQGHHHQRPEIPPEGTVG